MACDFFNRQKVTTHINVLLMLRSEGRLFASSFDVKRRESQAA